MKNLILWLLPCFFALSFHAQTPQNDLAVLYGDEDPHFICLLEDALTADYHYTHGLTDRQPDHVQKVPHYMADRAQQRQTIATKQHLGARVTAVQVVFADVEILNVGVNQLTVQATEHTALTYGEGDDQVIGRLTNKHRFVLQRTDNVWYLISDTILDESEAATLPPFTIDGLTTPGPELEQLDNAFEQLEITPKKAVTYDREAAMNYALNHAHDAHPDYRDFSPNDCTNFVSQCLLEGGWQETAGWYRSPNAWWYNRITQSWVWVNSQMFSDFLASSGRGHRMSNRYGLAVGDVLSMDRDGQNGIDHTMIVTNITPRDVFFSGRSNNRTNLAFSSIRSLHPNARYIFWRIVATY